MARIRTIKPEFFLHTGMAELTPLHRILFIGLWTQADKRGRLGDNPRKIKVTILPYDDCDINTMLDDLQNHAENFITRYKIDGQGKFIQINKFEEHQRPHHTEQDSVIPPLQNRSRTVQKPKQNRSETTGEGKGKEGKGREGKGKDIYTPNFLNFWTAYKKREEKPYAFSCYQKRMSEGITPEMILSHVEAYNRKTTAEQTEFKFIKNPSTFLNRTDFTETPDYPITEITGGKHDGSRGNPNSAVPITQAQGRVGIASDKYAGIGKKLDLTG